VAGDSEDKLSLRHVCIYGGPAGSIEIFTYVNMPVNIISTSEIGLNIETTLALAYRLLSRFWRAEASSVI
jgi:hypothetical protein